MEINNQSNIQYSYKLPSGEIEIKDKESNIATTQILTNDFLKIKESNKDFLREGEISEQKITLTNNTNKLITNLFFKDEMSEGASYVEESVVINGVSFPAYSLKNGFVLVDLAPNDSVEIKYSIKANSPKTHEELKNFANISYMVEGNNFSEPTNTIAIALLDTQLELIKSVDKPIAIIGDTLTYTNTIKNTSSSTRTKLFFQDILPSKTEFIIGSVEIDGALKPSLNPESGFDLPNLLSNTSTIITFKVKVVE